jgi:hypothetical protein
MNEKILRYCPECGLIINREEAVNESIDTFYLKKKNYTFSDCYDGPQIVSEKFVQIYSNNNLKGLSFTTLPKSPGFYLLRCNNIIHYDFSYNRKIYLKDKCSSCGQWYEVSCVYPIKIIDGDVKKMSENTFYRTDLESGEKLMRAPMLLVTDNIPLIFKENRIKDIYFSDYQVAGQD